MGEQNISHLSQQGLGSSGRQRVAAERAGRGVHALTCAQYVLPERLRLMLLHVQPLHQLLQQPEGLLSRRINVDQRLVATVLLALGVAGMGRGKARQSGAMYQKGNGKKV